MTLSDEKAPPCRVCGETRWVCIWDPKRPETTVCVECCPMATHENGETGHEFDRGSPLSLPSCIHCGAER